MSNTCPVCGKVFARMSRHLLKSKGCAPVREVADQNSQQVELPNEVLQEIEFVIKAEQLGYDLSDLVRPLWQWAGHWVHLPSETSLSADLNMMDTYEEYCIDPHECRGRCALNAPCLLCDDKRDVPSKMCVLHNYSGH